MDEIKIRGGRPLGGEVCIGGAKNAALPLLFAPLLTEERCTLENVPDVVDCRTAQRLLQDLGAEVRSQGDAVEIRAARLSSHEASYDLVKTMRASFLALGPLLAREGRARVATPGGCAIGSRPVDIHLFGFECLGAEVVRAEGYVEALAPLGSGGVRRLRGARIDLPFASVGATENLMIAASLAEGTTTIENAAREPEIVDLADALVKMGASISGAGTSSIVIEGRTSLSGFHHRVIPDRIEAGSFLAAVGAAGGDVVLRDARADHLSVMLELLSEAGVETEEVPRGLRVRRMGALRSVDVTTQVYPGFPTDLQAQWMALMCCAEGSSTITETIFENRFMHVQELVRLGADIKATGAQAVVCGVPVLEGAPVMATDLRASICLVVAGLAARGTTRLQRVYHLDRGYERLEEKLSGIGASIERIGGQSLPMPVVVPTPAVVPAPIAAVAQPRPTQWVRTREVVPLQPQAQRAVAGRQRRRSRRSA